MFQNDAERGEYCWTEPAPRAALSMPLVIRDPCKLVKSRCEWLGAMTTTDLATRLATVNAAYFTLIELHKL
jgi:hypothetical protein